AYVGVPFLIHRLRAAGLVASGKLDEARREIDAALAGLPANPDLAILLGPELGKGGHKKDAGAPFGRLPAVPAKLGKDYPKSAGLHNSLAWMCASCRRRLEEAQEHAQQAVELEPGLPGFRDTLAEVLFQRGRKAEAIAHIKKCIAMDPKRDYYRRQLKRFE